MTEEVLLPIEYLDSWRIARDKINNSFNKLVADVLWFRPHIENWVWWIWSTNTWVKAKWDSVYMRKQDWYIQYKSETDTEWTNLVALEDIKWDPWTDAWEYMTQDEYDELPDTKLTDNVSRMVFSDEEFYIKTLLRASDNILHYNQDDELYADLQFEDWLTPTSDFPIWVAIWNVDSTDWWTQSWLLLNARTDDTYMRWLYWDDWKLYFDWWLWVFKTIATTDDITSAVNTLRNELATVALTGKSSDLNNDYWFSAVPIMTQDQYDNTPWTAGDDKEYAIYDIVTT